MSVADANPDRPLGRLPAYPGSWITPTRLDADAGHPSLSVAWVLDQGHEYRMVFDTDAQRDAAASRLFADLAPEPGRIARGRSPHEIAREAGIRPYGERWDALLRRIGHKREVNDPGGFGVAPRVLTPDLVAELLEPATRFVIQPTSHDGRRCLERLGIDVWFKTHVEMTGEDVLRARDAAMPAAPVP